MYNFNIRYIKLFVFNERYIEYINYYILLVILTATTPHDHTQTDIPHSFIMKLIHNIILIP